MTAEKRIGFQSAKEILFKAVRSLAERPVENPPFNPNAPLPRGHVTFIGATRAINFVRHSDRTPHSARSRQSRGRHPRG